jgi:hypothetical protein
MGHVSNWLYDHSFHHEDPGRLGATPRTMWESVLLVILVVNLILLVIVLMFPNIAF